MGEFLKTKHFTIINNSNNESVIVNNEISELPIEYPCPEYITALLSSINNKLGIAYWNKYQKYYENLGLSEEKPNFGIYTEAEDFEYFKRNNKIINVDVAFAETGFLIGKKLGDKEM